MYIYQKQVFNHQNQASYASARSEVNTAATSSGTMPSLTPMKITLTKSPTKQTIVTTTSSQTQKVSKQVKRFFYKTNDTWKM